MIHIVRSTVFVSLQICAGADQSRKGTSRRTHHNSKISYDRPRSSPRWPAGGTPAAHGARHGVQSVEEPNRRICLYVAHTSFTTPAGPCPPIPVRQVRFRYFLVLGDFARRALRVMKVPDGTVIVVALNESGKRIGETHHNARIPDSVIDKIRDRHEEDQVGYVGIAREFGLSKNTVRKICTYERRAQTPVRWKRKKVHLPHARLTNRIAHEEPAKTSRRGHGTQDGTSARVPDARLR